MFQRSVACCPRRRRARPARRRRPGRHDHHRHLVSQGPDPGLQDSLREAEPGHQGRDPEQGHRPGNRLREGTAGRAASRHLLGQRTGRLRGDEARQAAGEGLRPGQQGRAGQDRQLRHQRSRRHVPRPGARWLRLDVEYALHEGQQGAESRGVGRPHQGRLLRPRGTQFALAIGHHAPDRRDHPAGRRMGQGLEPVAGNQRQQRPDHRAQLRRARRREQRAVRHWHRRRFLRPVIQVQRLSGGVRLPEGHRGGAGKHRAGQRRQERRGGAQVHLLQPVARRPGTAARPQGLAPAGVAGGNAGREGTRRLSEDLRDRQARQGSVRFRVVRIPLLPRLQPVRPDGDLPPQGTAGGDQGDTRCRSRTGEEAQCRRQRAGEAGPRPGLCADRQREPDQGSAVPRHLHEEQARCGREQAGDRAGGQLEHEGEIQLREGPRPRGKAAGMAR